MEHRHEVPAAYRSLFFWAWDDKLEPDEIRRQVRLMHAQGVGGFFMHSRFGLETPYLGKEWDEAVKAAVDEAKQLGMEAWIYDEDRWPSGFCGGRVQQAVGGLEGLTLEVTDSLHFQPEGTELLYWSAACEGDDLSSLALLQKPEERKGEKLLVLRLETSGPSAWFNGYPPPNNLDPKSEQEFLRLTHQHYADMVGSEFGKTLKGSFTDEPSMADRHAAFNPKRSWIPWASGMRAWVKELLGYDWLPLAPYLYFNHAESAKVRHDYWHVVALRYESCYTMQIATWCEAHGIISTGHFLQEDKLGLCTRVNGSVMPHYTHQDICGIDLLGEQTQEYLTLKQCSSVVHQWHKPGMLVETYAGTGWQFSFESMKWIGDWMYALGVTRRCQHLCLYSLRGCRKRDYPPSFNYHNSWYGKLGVMEEYFARLSEYLCQGEPRRDVLLLHPSSTAWMHMGCSPYGNPVRRNERDLPQVDALGGRLNELLRFLCGQHYDVDLGDETLIERSGRAEQGLLSIERASYPVVVLPEIETVYPSTFRLLKEFKEQGGTLILYKTVPSRLSGEPDEKVREFFQGCSLVPDETQLVSLLERVVPRPLSITEGARQCPWVITQVREDGKRVIAFAANNDRLEAHRLHFAPIWRGSVTRIDPFSGEQEQVQVHSDGSWDEEVEPTGSRLYLIDTGKAGETDFVERNPDYLGSLALAGPFRYRLDQPNVLTLDRCSYRLEDGPWSSVMEIWQAQEEVRRALGMVSLLDDEIAQRYTWDRKPHPNDGKKLSLRYHVILSADLPLTLVVEDARLFQVMVDGKPVSMVPNGYFLDRSFEKVGLGTIKSGIHELVLTCSYTNAMELENIYLVGVFGVDGQRVLGSLPATLSIGSWCGQGLFHYPGSVCYQSDFTARKTKALYLSLPAWKATMVTVVLNGTSFELPYPGLGGVDLSGAVQEGENHLSIRLWGSMRNMMGPLHLPQEPEMTGPGSFTTKGESGYHLLPYGLMESPVLLFDGIVSGQPEKERADDC